MVKKQTAPPAASHHIPTSNVHTALVDGNAHTFPLTGCQISDNLVNILQYILNENLAGKATLLLLDTNRGEGSANVAPKHITLEPLL